MTVPVGETTNPTAILLDPRGYRISSANVTFAVTPSPDDTGTVDFTGGATVQTAPDGTAWTTVTATSVGKISYAPNFVDTFATSVASGSGLRVTIDAVDPQNVQRIPRYQAVAWQPFAVAGFNVDGAARLSTGKYQHLPIEKAHTRRQAVGTVSVPGVAGPEVKLRSGAAMPRSIVSRPTDRVALAGAAGPEVVDASTAVPLPEPKARLVASTQSLTSCGDAKVVQENVPAGTVLHPPYTVTLTDNTPPTGGTGANGVVGADGIHGHRVGKTISLQLDIKDANGAAPTYPVLVQLNSVGVRHGAIILGPDGEAVTCPSASLVWRPTDDQGGPFANVVRYQLGTLSLYVGVQPDPNNSSQILPVWGSAESLVVFAEAKATGQPTATSTVMVGVHPQPWQPDHFLCIEDGAACPDLFEYWNGYQLDAESSPASSMPMVLLNAYFLKDMYENTVYGCTDTSATQPGSGITVGFADQTAADTEGDPAGYTLSTKWLMDPAPTGTPQSTLSVNYPQDPDNDWCSGTVSKEVTYQFDGGPTHLLVQAQSYEKRLEDMGQTVVDGPMPLIVAPGATKSLATLRDGGELTTPRLVLLALSGSYVTSFVTGWGTEPSSIPGYGWQKVLSPPTCPNLWCWQHWGDTWDLMLETQATAPFRLTLVDAAGRVATDGSFMVHTCPRAEHETDGPLPTQSCTDLKVLTQDGAGTVELTLNQSGSARGYLGIELTKAPIAPGTYYVWVESLGPAGQKYRIRRESDLVGNTEDDEYRGGFKICTVQSGEILDENFHRVYLFTVNEPTRAYVRYYKPSGTESTFAVSLHSLDGQGTEVASAPNVALTRIGGSAVFLSQPIQLLPQWVGSTAAPFLYVDRCDDGTITVTPAATTTTVASVMAASGEKYTVPLGITLPLRAYKGSGHQGQPGAYLCSPAATPSDCPTDPEVLIPSEQVTMTLVDRNGNPVSAEVARMENEPGTDPAYPAKGWYLRAIRTTVKPDGTVATNPEDGQPRVPNGLITVSATTRSGTATATVKITRPSSLECCPGGSCPNATGTCQTAYPGASTLVDLAPLVLDAADASGVPPQYLMAQVAREAGPTPSGDSLNAYAFRYEPTSRDFAIATGDHKTVADNQRFLLHTGKALFNLGINTPGGFATYLPCEMTTGSDPVVDNFQTTPCIPHPDPEPPPDQAPPVERKPPGFVLATLVPDAADPSGATWRIPNIDPSTTAIQLGVIISQGGDPLDGSGFTQIFGDAAPATATQYKVEPETAAGPPPKVLGRITFGAPPQAAPTAAYRPRPTSSADTGAISGFGRSLSADGGPTSLANTIVANNPQCNALPPDGSNLTMTIREWRRRQDQSGCGNQLGDTNQTHRYYKDFQRGELWCLLRDDPSFDVQGQWFASASYGLLQIIPESLRTNLARAGFDDDARTAITAIFDPTASNPALLFDPATCITLGAMMDASAVVAAERGDPLALAWDDHGNPVAYEEACPEDSPTKCSWERLWKRRLRVYNTGSQAGNDGRSVSGTLVTGGYANDVIAKSAHYEPQQ